MIKMHKKIAIITCGLLTAYNAYTAEEPDPLESYNRQVFHFNNTFDKTLLKPAATAYNKITPTFIQKGFTHFFTNLMMPNTVINDLLQAHWSFVLMDLKRFTVNTTLGVLGIFDVATHFDIPKHQNDFGTTFAYWTGHNSSTYTVLPFFGPSTLRDTLALPFDTAANPLAYCKSNVVSYGGASLYYIHTRAQLLSTDNLLDDAFDPYAAMRSAYLQTRNSKITANLNPSQMPATTHTEHTDRKSLNGGRPS